MFCKRCGRKLSSSISMERGYGSTCFAKIGTDEKKNKASEEAKVEEQNFVDELKEKVS